MLRRQAEIQLRLAATYRAIGVQQDLLVRQDQQVAQIIQRILALQENQVEQNQVLYNIQQQLHILHQQQFLLLQHFQLHQIPLPPFPRVHLQGPEGPVFQLPLPQAPPEAPPQAPPQGIPQAPANNQPAGNVDVNGDDDGDTDGEVGDEDNGGVDVGGEENLIVVDAAVHPAQEEQPPLPPPPPPANVNNTLRPCNHPFVAVHLVGMGDFHSVVEFMRYWRHHRLDRFRQNPRLRKEWPQKMKMMWSRYMALYNLLEDQKLARLVAQPELTGIQAMEYCSTGNGQYAT